MTVAVAGLGYFSQFHLNAWRAIDAVGDIHVTDPQAARVAWAQDTYGALDLSDDTAPDIVDIIAPPPAHAALIRRFAAKGRVLICQKPFRFALRPGDGRGADAYLARQPAFRDMPRLLVHETGVHFLDLFRWLFGEITDVYADIRTLNPVLAGEDTGVMILNHASGAQSIFDGNRLSDHVAENPRKTMGEMVIEGEKGALRLDGHGRLMFRAFGAQKETPVPVTAPVDEGSFGGGCVEALIRHVVDAVQNSAAFENTAADYLPIIRATDAAYASAAEGRKITL